MPSVFKVLLNSKNICALRISFSKNGKIHSYFVLYRNTMLSLKRNVSLIRGEHSVSGIWSGDMEKGETLKNYWSISAGQTEKISTWITEEGG